MNKTKVCNRPIVFQISESRPCFIIKAEISTDLQDAEKHQTRNKDSQYVE